LSCLAAILAGKAGVEIAYSLRSQQSRCKQCMPLTLLHAFFFFTAQGSLKNHPAKASSQTLDRLVQ
jgi:hypothetical protein